MQRLLIILLLAVTSHYGNAQLPPEKQKMLFISPEIMIGNTQEANTFFPERKLQKGVFVGLGKTTYSSSKAWARALGYPKTGVVFGISDFGNSEKIGFGYSLMPFLEFGLFQKKKHPVFLQMGFGVSYIDTKFDTVTNPFNKAITTDINWSYRAFFYYNFLKKQALNWRLGLGYLHHSNGHTRLPNQGLNSFLLSLSSNIGLESTLTTLDKGAEKDTKTRITETFVALRSGIGQHVLSEVFNTKKEVYSAALSVGKIYTKTFKFGVGLYYRFYEQYYEYIKNETYLIEDQSPHFKNNPYRYATTYGAFVSSELLLNHIGIGLDLGVNFYKPFYKIDWQISQGQTFDGVYFPAELNDYYRIKRTISGRLGLSYYLINTAKSPKNNFFIAAHINANLGQADFSELSLGYVHRFEKKQKP